MCSVHLISVSFKGVYYNIHSNKAGFIEVWNERNDCILFTAETEDLARWAVRNIDNYDVFGEHITEQIKNEIIDFAL